MNNELASPDDNIFPYPVTPPFESRREIAIRECDNSIAWYQKQGGSEYRMYKYCNIVFCVLLVFVPPLIISSWDSPYTKFVVAILATSAILLKYHIYQFHYYEDWSRFCSAENSLKREKTYYETNTGPYLEFNDREESLKYFVAKFQSIREKETEIWNQLESMHNK